MTQAERIAYMLKLNPRLVLIGFKHEDAGKPVVKRRGDDVSHNANITSR